MRKNKDGGIRTAVPRLSEYLHGDIGVVILALVLAALSAVMTIIGPNKIGDMATIMSDGLLGGIDLGKIAKIGIFLAAIYLLRHLKNSFAATVTAIPVQITAAAINNRPLIFFLLYFLSTESACSICFSVSSNLL